jgi:Rrf2 family protein
MRLEISRRADLATRSLAALATGGTKRKGADLAAELDASPGFLAQALTPLVARGWLRSEPGPTGGYSPAVALDEVSVLEVIEAVEGPTDTARCVLEGRPCAKAGAAQCALHVPWSRARATLLAELAATSLADVVREAPVTAPVELGGRR